MELPRYRSHKIVGGAKILGATPMLDGSTVLDLAIEGNSVPRSVDQKTHERMAHMLDSDTHDHDTLVGGYFVVYPDGYESWSPAKQFEDGYELIEE